MSSNAPQPVPRTSTRPMLPALPRAAFDQAYHSWSGRRHPGANFKDASYVVDSGRVYARVDTSASNASLVHLHLLHTEVLSAASYKPIVRVEQWQKIAGNLGLADRETTEKCGGIPMSSQSVATQLRIFYKKYLQDFDNVYLGSVLSSIPHQTLVVHPEDQRTR